MEEQRRLRRLLATQGVSTGAYGGSGDAGGEHRAPRGSSKSKLGQAQLPRADRDFS